MMFKIFNGMTEVYIKPRKTLKLTTTTTKNPESTME